MLSVNLNLHVALLPTPDDELSLFKFELLSFKAQKNIRTLFWVHISTQFPNQKVRKLFFLME